MPKPKKKFKDQLTTDIGDNIKSQNAAESAVAELGGLIVQAGWQRLVKELDVKIQSQTEEILDTDVQGEDLNRLRDRRDLCLWFRNLPEILSEYLKNPPVSQDLANLDPYSRPEVDNQEA